MPPRAGKATAQKESAELRFKYGPVPFGAMPGTNLPDGDHAVTPDDCSDGLILTVRSPDQAGIVASLAASIQAAGANIVELDQHTDVVEGDFGCRVEVANGVDAFSSLAAWLEIEAAQLHDYSQLGICRILRRLT